MGTVPRETPTPVDRQRGWCLAGIFLLAVVPRLAVVWSGIILFAPDTGTYLQPARNLIAGRGYLDDQGRPYSFRPPTYPLFLAAVFSVAGDSLRAVQVVQALLSAAGIAALALWVARRYGLVAGGATGVLLALDPILIPVPAFVLTEALGTLLVTGTVLCLHQGLATARTRDFVLAGLLGGAAALNTPITLLLVPWLLLTAWMLRAPRRPAAMSAVLALALVIACVGGWAVRNLAIRGEAILIRDNGFGSLVYATTEYDFDWLPSPHEPAYGAVQRKLDALAAGRTDSQAHNVYLLAAWQNFSRDPLLVIRRVLKANFWFWVEVPGYYVAGRLRPVRWIILGFHLAQMGALALAVWCLARAGRLRPVGLWIATVVYFALFLSPMMPIPRYYVPLLPVIDTLIAVGLAHGLGCWAPQRFAPHCSAAVPFTRGR